MSRILPLLLATLAACAGRELRPDETVVHVRELVAVAPDGSVAVLEVTAADGLPPRAVLSRWTETPSDDPPLGRERRAKSGGWIRSGRGPSRQGDGPTGDADASRHPVLGRTPGAAGGERRPVLAEAEPREAARLAALAPGGGLGKELPPALARAVAAAPWSAPGPEAGGPPWIPPELPGRAVYRREVDDPRYGPTVLLVLRDETGREEEVARFPGTRPPALALRWLPGNRAAVAVRPPEVPGLAVADVAVLDLGPAAARLLATEADGLAASGDRSAARERLALARSLAPGEPAIPYREAALLVAAGDRDGALAALARAIALDPSLYRMRARTDPALDPLRDDPAFADLVRPRPLPGGRTGPGP